jgi:hypothetical protein
LVRIERMRFTDVMEHVAQGFEAIGVAVLVLGLLWSAAVAAQMWRAAGAAASRRCARLSAEFSCLVWRS